jgi:hypothetical protein
MISKEERWQRSLWEGQSEGLNQNLVDRPDDSDRIAQANECDRERRCAEAQSSKVKSQKFLEV